MINVLNVSSFLEDISGVNNLLNLKNDCNFTVLNTEELKDYELVDN